MQHIGWHISVWVGQNMSAAMEWKRLSMSEFKKANSSPQSQGNGQFANNKMLAREKRFEEIE
jgi:hypothetical protein